MDGSKLAQNVVPPSSPECGEALIVADKREVLPSDDNLLINTMSTDFVAPPSIHEIDGFNAAKIGDIFPSTHPETMHLTNISDGIEIEEGNLSKTFCCTNGTDYIDFENYCFSPVARENIAYDASPCQESHQKESTPLAVLKIYGISNQVHTAENMSGQREETGEATVREGAFFDSVMTKSIQENPYDSMKTNEDYKMELPYPENVAGTTSQAVKTMSAKEREKVLENRKIRNRASARRSRANRRCSILQLRSEICDVLTNCKAIVIKCEKSVAENERYREIIRRTELELNKMKSEYSY